MTTLRKSDAQLDCRRCAEIRASRPEDLLYLWQPGMTPEREREMGEQVRALALAMHAAAGHA